MAVQKSRKSRAKRDSRRGHDKVYFPKLSIDNETGETHRRHHITKMGYYLGKQVIQKKQPAEEKKETN